MRYEIVHDFPHDIIYEEDDVCISIYQPTHRYAKGTQEDKILFKNQIQKVERNLEKRFKEREIQKILQPLYELEQDHYFWSRTNDGIAILMNRSKCIIYNLFRDIKELTVVSDSFHIKPLLRVYQSADKYYVLGVNRQTFKLYYGDRYELRELEFDEDTPVDIEDVLEEQYADSQLERTSSRGRAGTQVSTHGYGSKEAEVKKDTDRFLRYVDRFVIDNYSKPAKAPLVLVSLTEYQGEFRKLSHNNFLLKDGINKDFKSMSNEDIRKESWGIVEKLYLDRTNKLVDNFEIAKSRDSASDNLSVIARRTIENRIDSILIEADKIIPGTIELENGKIELGEIPDKETGDILDKIAERVLLGKGEVVMLPKERMPTDTGVAAVFRY